MTIIPLALLALQAAPSFAADVAASSRVSSVVVYADRALVTRSVRVQVEPGESAVSIAGLPPALVEDSLTGSVKSGPARLGGIELRRTFTPQSADERVRSLEREIEKLQDQQAELGNKVEVDKKALDFADKLAALEAERTSRDAVSHPLNPAEWDAAVKWLSGLRTARFASIQKTQGDLRDVQRTIEARRRELDQIRAGRSGETRTATLMLSAREGGESTIELRYVVPGAGWTPGYDARGDVQGKQVELTSFALVRNQTAEPWDDVELALSTARPSLGASMPELSPIFLSPGGFFPRPLARAPMRAAKMEAAPSAMMAEEAAPAPPQGGWETTEVEASGVSVQFKLPRRQTIPSSEAPRRVTIDVEKLPATLTYETTPKLAPLAYLRATCRNTTEVPLLGGPVNAFLGGDFLGQSRIDTTAPGQELPLQLGADERIKVKRERLVEKTKDSWWGKKLVLTQSFRIRVENFTGAPQTVTVIDQIPVSQDASIEVRSFKSDPDPTLRRDDTGELRWKLDLDGGGKRTIEFGYEVVFPESLSSQPAARDQILHRSASF